MKVIKLLILLFFVSSGFSQNEKKQFKGVKLAEEFTLKNFEKPNSILFFSSGHWEIEKYYNILFKRLKKEFKKSKIKTEFVFENNDSIPAMVKSFEEIELKNTPKNSNIICVFTMGNLESNLNRISRQTGQTFFLNQKKIMYYDLFVILLDTRENKILLKRKLSVEANEIYYSNNKNVARAIVQEIKI